MDHIQILLFGLKQKITINHINKNDKKRFQYVGIGL